MNFIEVNNYADACEILEKDPTVMPDVSAYDEEDKEAALATFALWNVSKAAWKAEGKKINYDDYNQPKYYGWFDMRSTAGSGSGFSFNDYRDVCGLSVVGARLSFPSRESLLHAVKVFEPQFKAAYTKK